MDLVIPIKVEMAGQAFVWPPEFKARLAELMGPQPVPTKPEEIPAAVRLQLRHEGWQV